MPRARIWRIGRLRQRLERAGNGDFPVANVGDEHLGGDVLVLELLAQGEVLDLVEKIDDLLVRAEPEGAQEGGGEELPAAFAAVKINVEQVVGVELNLEPGAAIRDDPERVERLAVQVQRGLERDAGRAVQLRDHHALGAVDDEGALRRHERNFAHVHFLLLDALFLLQPEGDVERRGKGLALALALESAHFRIADVVRNEVEDDFLVVALDGEDLAEYRLEADLLALRRGDVLLEELDVGIQLDLDEVGRLGGFLEFTEIDSLGHDAVWWFLPAGPGPAEAEPGQTGAGCYPFKGEKRGQERKDEENESHAIVGRGFRFLRLRGWQETQSTQVIPRKLRGEES